MGAGGYGAVGLLGLWWGIGFLDNVLPAGTPGQLPSSGTILALNLVVALAVAAGFVLLLTEFLEQTLEVRRRSKSV
jgi:multicomponent Na+:H+ antiporter subunit B